MAQQIVQQGSFDATVANQINLNFQQLGMVAGNIVYIDPFSGFDGYTGQYPSAALRTLQAGYNALREGKNDVAVLLANGLTTSTARLSSGFTWSKNEAHLMGYSSGVNISNRSRIAPTAGVTAFAAFFTVSGSGCLFSNIQFFQGFDTGTTAAICMSVSGGRNMFQNCHIAGMGDTASAQSSTSRNLVVTGTGENEFVNCTIGLDTVTSNTTNASLEFAAATPRNQFRGCIFPRMTSSAGTLFITVLTGGIDRFQYFDRCVFINAVNSSSTTMTAACTLAASAGGMLFMKDCTVVGATDLFSDATTAAQMWIDGAAPTTTTSGLAVHPA